jgi:hypothetical protein
LGAFDNLVSAQVGKEIAVALGEAWLAYAQRIIKVASV